jgi:histidinol-phosphate/aromatic aminotransferase/cobyric acid decarboxylase-like protein
MLAKAPGLDLRANTNVHFQYAFCEQAHTFAEVMRNHGIGVRVLSRAHGVTPDALRIVAPRADERQHFATALESVIND